MNIITVNKLTKIYHIYEKDSDRLKEAFLPRRYHQDFYALKDVSFTVEKGETIGIIGVNGAGKSTLLKILTGVLKQTEGTVKVEGRVSALLELGVGFDEDCTGLENIYIHAALLGMSRKEIERRKQKIIDFADIGDFITQPVKTYSSGMLVRLAFSVAINVDPEILIIDEALAVGDIFFQAKCFEKLEEIKRSGVTIVFVSHDLLSVKRMCSRAIWIEKGEIEAIGEANEICEMYSSRKIEQINREIEPGVKNEGTSVGEYRKTEQQMRVPRLVRTENMVVSGTGKARIISSFFRGADGKILKTIRTGSICTYCMVVCFDEYIEKPLFGFELENTKGARVYGVNNYMLGQELEPLAVGQLYVLSFSLLLPKIHSGEYLVTPAIASGIQAKHIVHDRLHNYDTVMIENDGFDSALIELDADFSIAQCREEDIIFT